MIKILFVCHGNICRSPMAEFIMKDMVKKAGLERRFEIESAGTSREELGNPVYPPAKRELAALGLSCKGKYARQMTRADYDYWDLLVCMDDYNLRNMLRITGGDPEGKMRKLLKRDVADPYYMGNFDTTRRDILEGCAALLEELR